ncbi:MAG TPA: hypothetical protein VK469_01415, partial [Candidatus Kapabacteria bacterium]|nr:hypothetical protein [Candidatus Kapabacteria bacterium]
RITSELIERVVSEVDKENRLLNYQPLTDKHQVFIDYIKNNKNIHEECLTTDLLFNLTENGFDEKLTELLTPKCFDEIILEKSVDLDNETRVFISRLYEDVETNEKDDKTDEDGNPLPNSKKDILEALKREIDTEIIQQSLLNYKITAASFKEVMT